MHFHLKTILQTSADFTIIIFDIPNRIAYMALYFLRIIIYIEIPLMVQLLRLRNFDID